MARNKKKKQLSQNQQLVIAERELEKGNAREALKRVKACFRLDRSDAVRSLLQRALLSRGRELQARSMLEPARAVIVELDELGEVSAEYQADASRLRALLGLADGLDSFELGEDQGLRNELADQAVLLNGAGPQFGGLTETAETVRAGLDAAENGKYASAIELVASIGRDSPFCDWKLLVRGLCAYYQQDDQRANANWTRLASNRPARRIADTLSLLMDVRRYADAPRVLQTRVDQLARSIETPLLRRLRVLQRKFADPACRPRELRTELRRFMSSHAKEEPAIAQRVANIFIQRAINQEDAAGLAALKRCLPKLPLDPKFNRANALLAEATGELSRIRQSWDAYAKDLQSCELLSDSQKATATALVYSRIAVHLVNAFDQTNDAFDCMSDAYTSSLQDDAIFYFRKSLEANRALPGVHLELGQLLAKQGNRQQAAATFKELGRRFPDDADSLIAIAKHFIASNDPGMAKEFAEKARVLRPRDTEAVGLVWSACLGTAREAAKQRQFGLAEAELGQAESFLGAGPCEAYLLHSIRAAVAFKQGDLDAAERSLNDTIDQFELPTAALLLVDSQARRCRVAAKKISELGRRLAKALKGRTNAQAAGTMAKYLYALKTCNIEYQGLATHNKQVGMYLKRCGRVKWQAGQLRDACQFASSEASRQSLLEELADRGTTLFPNHPVFHFFKGKAEMAQGPFACNYDRASRAFERAIELDTTGDISLDESDRQSASRALSLLEMHCPPSFGAQASFDDGPFFDDDEGPDNLEEARKTLERLMATMPPDLRRQFDEVGLSPLAALREILLRGLR